MKLLLRRNQKPGVVRGPTFTLEVRAEISAEDKANIQKYGLGNLALYMKYDRPTDFSQGWNGLWQRVKFDVFKNLTLTINDLYKGKTIACGDVVEMLQIEAEVRDAAQRFVQILHAAQHFGGEEVIEI